MGRGVSAGGGRSSLGYLFGGGEAAVPPPPAKEPITEPDSKNSDPDTKKSDVDKNKQTPPTTTSATNNYFRTDGQNCGNFITDRPSTKVHAAPGGGSSLDYLFGDGKK
ncbi:SPIRAL1-like1 [Perilla frutescens var. frutescens]|nr:SPIRAL1-like1 [Perilla frutescens var. frutescens]